MCALGYRSDPVSVPGSNETITLRGIKNFDGMVEFAMQNGLSNASELVVTGTSAGGLSTFLHVDR
jgi:hypothetical protein